MTQPIGNYGFDSRDFGDSFGGASFETIIPEETKQVDRFELFGKVGGSTILAAQTEPIAVEPAKTGRRSKEYTLRGDMSPLRPPRGAHKAGNQ